MKKTAMVLPALLALVILLGGVGTVAADGRSGLANFSRTRVYDASFSDIDGHWARHRIVAAYEYGLMHGVGGGRFDPAGYFTVAQAIAVAARIHMIYTHGETGHAVSDGTIDHWAAANITYAKAAGLIGDEWDDVPDNPVTRAEAVRIWSRILQPQDMARVNTVYNLPDVTPATPFFEDIVLFYEAGLMQGSTIDGVPHHFIPFGTLSRAEAATMFMRLIDTDSRTRGLSFGVQAVFDAAGTGTSGFSDGAAEGASFTLPHSIAIDADGTIVVFDTFNNAIRLVSDGLVQTLSGQWLGADEQGFSRGFYRDGVLADALFNRPTDGVFNAAGDLFITDSENHVIRMIRGERVYTFSGSVRGHADGAGDRARFDTPKAVAVDAAGYLYVADSLNNAIRRIDPRGNVTTIAGVPGEYGYRGGAADTALFRQPSGIAVSPDGRVVFVADTGNHVIRKIENGRVTTLSGITIETDEDGDPVGDYRDGATHEAMFNLPGGLSLAGGVLFVADSGNNVIRAVNIIDGRTITTAGTGEPGAFAGGLLTAEFSQPLGIFWHDGTLYIADTTNNLIRRLGVTAAMPEEVYP